MANRYCSNCGQELGADARFCPGCGRPVHEVARVTTPEADVEVPPLPGHQDAGVAAESGDKRTALIALGLAAGVIVAIIIGAATAGGQGVGVVLVLLILPTIAVLLRAGGHGHTGHDEAGRVVLRDGGPSPVGMSERSRVLEEEVAQYMSDGFFVRQRTETTAQLVKPKKFSFLWALLWFLVFGIGIVVYLIYYAAKRDEGRYVEVDQYGAARATRQVHHVL